MDIADLIEAVRIGTGSAKMPRSWVELLTDDQRERNKWQESEFRREDEPTG